MHYCAHLDDLLRFGSADRTTEHKRKVRAANKAELAARHVSVDGGELVVADGSPTAVEEDLERSRSEAVDILAVDQPQIPLLCTDCPIGCHLYPA